MIRSISIKILLCTVGFWLIGYISGTMYAPFVLACCSLVSYGIASVLQWKTQSNFSVTIGRAVVPLALLTVVFLNMTGLIGTLTGSTDSSQQSYMLLLAAPFYLLSMAAFVSDIALNKLQMPRFLDYLTYVTLPFKLLAGPLDLPRLIIKIQHLNPRFNWWRFSAAWPWIALGAFMKYVIANRLSPAEHISLMTPVAALTTAAVFELKFYFDFAGYSFIGYGMALIFGLRISQNFAHPFFAPNVVTFWRRWHMSLGRYLSRYILEPNLALFSSRQTKIIFASGIFLVSALWHGGTGNYILWGIFHGVCYYLYVQYLKRKTFPYIIGVIAMVCFFVLGRFLAIDSEYVRLLRKIYLLISNFWIYNSDVKSEATAYILNTAEIKAIFAATAFLMLEYLSIRMYSVHRAYHLFRKPLAALCLLIIFLLFGINSGDLLYARI